MKQEKHSLNPLPGITGGHEGATREENSTTSIKTE